nr:hypothetical protein GCM10017745_42800 [Saccharothrix mutabilis subsp. capreolus]
MLLPPATDVQSPATSSRASGSGMDRNARIRYSMPFSTVIRPMNPTCRPSPSRSRGVPPVRSRHGDGIGSRARRRIVGQIREPRACSSLLVMTRSALRTAAAHTRSTSHSPKRLTTPSGRNASMW